MVTPDMVWYNRIMKAIDFQTKLQRMLTENITALQDDKKDWIVKGFIDIYKTIYTISIDTKVVSKIIELMLFPVILKFAQDNGLKMILAAHQNHYPDVTFIDESDNTYFAMDIKSTYRVTSNKVNGFTLGAFTGYFRNRTSTKNITLPYEKYNHHFVLGVIYSQQSARIDEEQVYSIDNLDSIMSVASDFDFIVQEKYKIATSRPGSGNTKNIGSITNISRLKSGDGPFSELGAAVFDDYWMFYQTKDMVRGDTIPYSNLEEYVQYKSNLPRLKNIAASGYSD